jgi:hypothetical protein
VILGASAAMWDFINRYGGSATLGPRFRMRERSGKIGVDGDRRSVRRPL